MWDLWDIIATIFIYEGLRGISTYFHSSQDKEQHGYHLQLLVALGTLYLSLQLLQAESWVVLNKSIRLAGNGITLAVVFMSGKV